jgi:hypothetical protein
MWLQFTFHSHTHAYAHVCMYMHTYSNVHSHIFTGCCSPVASNGRRSLSSVFPNCPRLRLSFSQQRLTRWSPSGSLMYQLTTWTPFTHWFRLATISCQPLTQLLKKAVVIQLTLSNAQKTPFLIIVTWITQKISCLVLFPGLCIATAYC